MRPAECNGICLYGADIGVPEHGGVAYPHPDCPEHGDPVYDEDEPGNDEDAPLPDPLNL